MSANVDNLPDALAEIERLRDENEAMANRGGAAIEFWIDRNEARLARALQEQARMRFDEFGPHDVRGAAFWDAHVGILEGRLGLPVPVGGE